MDTASLVRGAAALVVIGASGAACAEGLASRLRDAGSTLPAGMDFDGDGIETRVDIAFTVYSYLHDATGGIDDHEIDFHNVELYEQIQSVVAASLGDANNDGVIDETDFEIVADGQGSDWVVGGADIDQSTTVDQTDFFASLDAIMLRAGPLEVDVGNAACLILAEFEAAATIFAAEGNDAGVPLPTDDQGNVLPSATDSNWPTSTLNICGERPDHSQAVSRSYPDDHQDATSDAWPPNHSQTFSSREEWDESWPPNHDLGISLGWDEIPERHSEITSGQWRPGHHVDASMSWEHRPPGPNHSEPASIIQWDGHLFEASALWPAGHWEQQSDDGIWPHREDHSQAASAEGYLDRNTHYAPTSMGWTHNEGVSGQWPPSHDFRNSVSWHPGHQLSTSIGWPANHQSFVSGSWGPGVYPGIWPPSHNGHTSTGWGEPAPVPDEPGFFPPGHTFYTTTLDILPLLPF